ncbi:MAG TPA: hypothetical protein DD723_00430 [Candidatus Omnitrophica bacterium]|nr:MAG: hypothetical protein A2Z81_03030 [Omnitrophica WOR_2 bacterium GWA2_45_18]HBR13997.1 hypothetical protein [Candidatus Omnitrophota bacterium]
MFYNFFVLACLNLAVLYPLCLWSVAKNPLKNDFYKFHLGLPNFFGGIAVICFLLLSAPLTLKLFVLGWKCLFLYVTFYNWKKPYPKMGQLTATSFLGMFLMTFLLACLFGPNPGLIFMVLLSGFILSFSLFSLGLGFWYAQNEGLSFEYLRRTVRIFIVLLFVRWVWDVGVFFTGRLLYQGQMTPVSNFLFKSDGFLLFFVLWIGTLLPLAMLYFVKGSLNWRRLPAINEMLSSSFCLILAGDVVTKYYTARYFISM